MYQQSLQDSKFPCLFFVQATISEKLNHQCPYCEAAFASKTRVEKHKAWNHADRVSQEPTAGNEADNEVQKTPVKGSAKKRYWACISGGIL